AGKMRKVGPSLRYLSQKTTTAFVETWTKEPKAFRPSTKMPQFFDLTNQTDSHAKNMMPVEIAAITHYLMSKSSANEVALLEPPQNHKPDIVRGKKMFSQKGCLACHSHKEFPGATQTFGPRLDNVNQKIKPGKEGFKWLFSWIRDPQRYHKRSKMPDLFIKPKEAADITAFLLQGKSGNFKPIKVDDKVLDELTSLFLQSALTKADLNAFMASRKYPIAPQDIKGDEIEFVNSKKGKVTDEEWEQMRLSYVGRRTISRYGCFGCHDIPGFEKARPIGTALQDWGRKDTSKLALEHISEFLHHHGEADGSSTSKRVEKAKKQMKAGGYSDKKLEEEEMRTAFFYESLHHHGRPGFLWQKLRAPRSYDYEKIEVKRYDERLKMPKFPLKEDEIEEIATFILGLTADPPTEQYIYHPDKRTADRIEGERLLKKFNCVGCHMMELPKFKYGLPTKTPGLDNGLAGLIGMPKKDIISWLNTNREKLIKGDTVEIPEEIDVVLYNMNEFIGEKLKGKKLTPQQQAAKLAQLIEAKYQDNRRYDKLNAFFAKHPLILLAGKMESGFYPQFVEQLLAMKKPQSGNTEEKFFNALDFANWLKAIAKKPHPAHQGQLRKLRELGVNTDQIQKLAKSIVDGKYKTKTIAFINNADDKEAAESIEEVEIIAPRRKMLVKLFDNQGKIIVAMLNIKEKEKKKERSGNFKTFGKWLIEKNQFAREKIKKAIEEENKRFSKKDKKGKTLTKKDVEAILSFLKIAKKEKWDIKKLASSFSDESLLQDLSEEIAAYKKNVTKRIELTKLFDANKDELTQVLGGAVVQFHGLYNSFPDKKEPLLGQFHSLNLWETLKVNNRLLLPSKNITINQTRLIKIQPARGGEFAEWMVRNSSGKRGGTLGNEWAKAPPALISQGAKVQTPWLYRFLKEPTQIRFSTVLRMPKFNMSDEEARALANYFAAVDDVPYPYQLVPERKPLYAEKMNSNVSKFLIEKDVMTESWKMLNADLCIKCHSVGGRQFIQTKAKPNAEPPSQGPDLFNVQNRLRPDWVKVWIANPKWFIPHTKMPLNFPRKAPGKKNKKTLFDGRGDLRTIGVRDALMNYRKLIEAHGKTPTAKPLSTVAPNKNNDKKKQ
ncbi:probable cytochrome oxidase (cbb3-type), partial [hydrothermal vent metagenome]